MDVRPASLNDTDRALGFLIPGRNARGRIVRLGAVADTILAAHAYAETPARLLAETLALAAMMGTILRPDEGQVTVQAQPAGNREGPVRLLVADYLAGAVRGYVAVDPDKRLLPGDDLAHIFGDGRLVITVDQTVAEERYQGIVALEGPSLASAAEGYFRRSEQIPTLVRLAAARTAAGAMVAGGFIVQHLARPEEGATRLDVGESHPDWAHVESLAATLGEPELTDPDLGLETILWRLFHEDEVRVLPAVALSRGCRCSADYIRSVLMRFPEAERAQMRGSDGAVSVDCEFCAKTFLLRL